MRLRAGVVATAVTLAVAAGALVAEAPASAAPAATPTASPTRAPRPTGTALAVDVLGSSALTLPAKDGLRDRTSVRIRSGAKGDVDLLAVRGRKVVHLADAVHLVRRTTVWQRTVTVAVEDLPLGSWTLRARRSADHAVRAAAAVPLAVGSGKPVHVFVRPAARTVYPWKDRVLDTTAVTVTGTDETGAAIPLHGTVRLDAAKLHRTRTLARGAVSIPVTGLPLGAATLTTTVTGPAGKKTVRRTPLALAPTGVGTQTLARSSDTLYPIVDGWLDSETITTSATAVAGSPATVSGTLTITRGTTTAASWTVPNGAPHAYSWNGRVGGVIVPGTYTATLTLHGPEGAPRVTRKTLVVSKQHLAYRVQDQFTVGAGNQQGLAVHNGLFYVGFDNGDGTDRIDQYRADGSLVASLQNVHLGHIAELGYSTTTGLLYAANGGATNPTTVWALKADWSGLDLNDGQSAVVDTIDLTALGNNGMVAVDDANQRLLVFAGTAPNYTVTPVSLAAVPDATDSTVLRHTVGASAPIAITGVPQGIEVVGSQLWVYTSLKKANHVAQYDLASLAPGVSSDLMWEGEGEGSGVDTASSVPAFFIGAHDTEKNGPNHIGLLVPVGDE